MTRVFISFLWVGCGGGVLNVPGEDTGDAETCPSLAIDSDSVFFRDARLGVPESLFVTLDNDCVGQTPLSLDFKIEPSSAYFYLSQVPEVLEPGAVHTLEVLFITHTYDSQAATLSMISNDPNQPIATLALAGQAAFDQDGDGLEATQAGGTDCDDLNAAVFPGAEEVYYDGVDGDCDGASDYDQDRDGYDRSPQGQDCDDRDAARFPGQVEADNLMDDDCDGLVDEDAFYEGMVRITEGMLDPFVVFDASGEWIEVFNRSARTLNLTGWSFTANDGDQIIIENDLIVAPLSYAVVGNNDDFASNGGVIIAYVYDGKSLGFDNVRDVVTLSAGDLLMDSLSYDSTWPTQSGAALMVDQWLFETDGDTHVSGAWCAAQKALTGGDYGTPGEANGLCASVDHDGDGYSALEGDCDDFSVDVFPGQLDWMNGLDDDCDGTVDQASIDVLTTSTLAGDGSGSFLGSPMGLGVGDVTGDGNTDLFFGASRQDLQTGAGYLLTGHSAYTATGKVSTHASVVFDGVANYAQFGRVDTSFSDNTGDGAADVIVTGSDYSVRDGVHAALFKGGASLSGALDSGDAYMTWTGLGPLWGVPAVEASSDLDGDGVAELLLGYPSRGSAYGGVVGIYETSGLSSGAYDLTDADRTLDSDAAYQGLGTTLTGSDVDTDGYDDVIMCGLGYRWSSTSTYADASCWLIFGGATLGSDDDVDDAADIKWSDTLLRSREFGASASFGDIDDDGTTDLILGAPGYNTVYVYLNVAAGSGTLSASDADYAIAGGAAPSFFGQSLNFGDVNQDGIPDLLIGAPDVGSNLVYSTADEKGVVYVYEGGVSRTGSLTESDAEWQIIGESVGDGFGHMLLVSDIDDDGDQDLVVNAPGALGNAGRVYFLDLTW